MEEFRWATKRFWAWGSMPCPDTGKYDTKKPVDHMPHIWDNDNVVGPFFCWGFPRRKDEGDITNDDLRHLIDEAMRPVRPFRRYMIEDSEEAKAFDHIEAFVRGEDIE